VGIFDRVLHAGEVGRGVFGKVESSGKVCSFFFFIRSCVGAWFD